jgi:hypothetical protein
MRYFNSLNEFGYEHKIKGKKFWFEVWTVQCKSLSEAESLSGLLDREFAEEAPGLKHSIDHRGAIKVRLRGKEKTSLFMIGEPFGVFVNPYMVVLTVIRWRDCVIDYWEVPKLVIDDITTGVEFRPTEGPW